MSVLYVDNLQPNLGSQVEIPNLKPLAGSVVQVKTHSFLGGGAFTSTGFSSISKATFSFTPKFATSKLYISANYAYAIIRTSLGNGGFSIRTFHDGTNLFNGITGGYNIYDNSMTSTYGMLLNNFDLIDAVNTNARNITADCRVYTSGNTLHVGFDSDNAESVITVMEIAQ